MKKTTEREVSNSSVAVEDFNSPEYQLKIILNDVVKEDRSLSDEIIGGIALIISSIVLVFEKGRLITRIVVLLPLLAMVSNVVTSFLQRIL